MTTCLSCGGGPAQGIVVRSVLGDVCAGCERKLIRAVQDGRDEVYRIAQTRWAIQCAEWMAARLAAETAKAEARQSERVERFRERVDALNKEVA